MDVVVVVNCLETRCHHFEESQCNDSILSTVKVLLGDGPKVARYR